MRFLSLVVTLLAILAFNGPTAAEETDNLSIVEGVKTKAQPLLKALSLLGTPYKFGGNNPEKGLDCSGFVKHVYKESADISLPRSAAEMSQLGEMVAKEELKPGDLVFFNTMRRAFSHVGVYVGDGKFIHAPRAGKAVNVEDMRSAYWQKRFNGARRVPVNGDNPKHENSN
jgi:cell wall-associated NlpC family hydrolase